MNNVDVVYTMWDNLKKTAGMDVGQVGFYKQKEASLMLGREEIWMNLNSLQSYFSCWN